MCRHRSIILAVLLLGACAGNSTRTRAPVPVEDQSSSVYTEQDNQEPGSSGVNDPAAPPDRQEEMNPVVVALLNSAEQELQSGRQDYAAAVIERALNLEPKNAFLWSRLAEIRLQQGNWQQSYVMANKSNSLAQGNLTLQIRNWEIIEKARIELGDMTGSAEARETLKKLRRQRG